MKKFEDLTKGDTVRIAACTVTGINLECHHTYNVANVCGVGDVIEFYLDNGFFFSVIGSARYLNAYIVQMGTQNKAEYVSILVDIQTT